MNVKKSSATWSLLPRLRIMHGDQIAVGPGRVELLEHIGETGSLRAAAARMDMSYMRAWTLVKSLNSYFPEPLVKVTRGGQAGGGAQLTAAGRTLVAAYRPMEKRSQAAMKEPWRKLSPLLRD